MSKKIKDKIIIYKEIIDNLHDSNNIEDIMIMKALKEKIKNLQEEK